MESSSTPIIWCALRPATRTMKNSSRLLAEIDRNRIRSRTGCRGLHASSSTRRLKASQLSSRLKNCGSAAFGSFAGAAAAVATSAGWSISLARRREGMRSILPTAFHKAETGPCYNLVTLIGM